MENTKHPRNVTNYFKENPDERACYRCSNCRRVIEERNNKFLNCGYCDYPSRSRQIFHRKPEKKS